MRRILAILIVALAWVVPAAAQELDATKIYLGSTPCTLLTGSGSPEGVVSAPVCSTYWRTDTGQVWTKTSGSGNTGWVAVTTGGVTGTGTSGYLTGWTGTSTVGATGLTFSGNTITGGVWNAGAVTSSGVGAFNGITTTNTINLGNGSGSRGVLSWDGNNDTVLKAGSGEQLILGANAGTGLTFATDQWATLASGLTTSNDIYAQYLWASGYGPSSSGGNITFRDWSAVEVGNINTASGRATFKDLTVGDGTAQRTIVLNAAAGTHGYIGWQKGGNWRWLLTSDTMAESGSMAGSNFGVYSYTDAGEYQRENLGITRSTGAWNIRHGVYGSGGLTITYDGNYPLRSYHDSGGVGWANGTGLYYMYGGAHRFYTGSNYPLDVSNTGLTNSAGYTFDIGSLTHKYRSLHAAELWVETLVAQQKIATIGGRIAVGPANILQNDIDTSMGFATVTSGMITTSGVNSPTVGYMTNGVYGDSAWHTDSAVPGAYIRVDFGGGNEKYIRGGAIWATGTSAAVWRLEVSNDASSWATVCTLSSLTSGATVCHNSTSAGAYRYARWYLTNTPGGGAWQNEFELYTEFARTFKYNNIADGDVFYMEADGKVEWFQATDGGQETVWMIRNLDRSGRNTWYAGDAVLNTGSAGDGFIDLYSTSGVFSSYGPTIAGNVRNSATFSDVSTAWAIGNLNGLYGYTSDIYGVGLGKFANGSSYLIATPTGGIRMYQRASGTEYERFRLAADGSGFLASSNIAWDTSGNTTIAGWAVNSAYLGTSSGSGAGMAPADYPLYAGASYASRASAPFRVTTAGDVTMTSATITGGSIRQGQTDYDTGTGFWLGNSSGTPKFSIGNSSANRITWDGTNVLVKAANLIINSSGVTVAPASSAAWNVSNGYAFGPLSYGDKAGVFAYEASSTRNLGVFNGVTSTYTATTYVGAAHSGGNWAGVQVDANSAGKSVVVYGNTIVYGTVAVSDGSSLGFGVGYLKVGSPSSPSTANGRIDAQAVYDDGTLLTDWVFDLAYDGRTSVPHAGRLWSLPDVEAITLRERRLPWMPTQGTFDAARSLGGMVTRLWEGQEQQQLHIFTLRAEIAQLRAQIARLMGEQESQR